MYWLTGLLGVACATAPFVLNYSSDGLAMWSSLAVGAILIASSLMEGLAHDTERWEYWVAGIMGAVAIVAPFLLGFHTTTPAVWTMVIVGLLALIASGTKLTSNQTG